MKCIEVFSHHYQIDVNATSTRLLQVGVDCAIRKAFDNCLRWWWPISDEKKGRKGSQKSLYYMAENLLIYSDTERHLGRMLRDYGKKCLVAKGSWNNLEIGA